MNEKQIKAIEALRDAAADARKSGLTENQISQAIKPEVKIMAALAGGDPPSDINWKR